MDSHGISFVGDCEMAEGHDFALVSLPDGTEWIFYRESRVSPQCLEDSWTAYRKVLASDSERPDPGGRESTQDPNRLRLVI